MTERIARFLAERQPETPCLIVDIEAVQESYESLHGLLPVARIFYAVKANPAPEILRRLVALGSSFDTASPGEIDQVLAAGATPERISFGNTIKKERDIAYAYGKGVRLFAFDSEPELEKIARAAPGASVFCRVLTDCTGAEWPLSRKFGCAPTMAAALMLRARERGLDACGLSFHVGSQQTDLGQWEVALKQVANLFKRLAADGLELRLANIGGGFPATYARDIPPLKAYADAVMHAMTKHFGNRLPEIIIEPGRSMVGDAGVIQSEVVLISQKDFADRKRWVYLDIGRFGGLAETEGEAIRYRIKTRHDGASEGSTSLGPVVLAGPTCDSADVMYENRPYMLPLDLAVGDKVEIQAAGAYTSTYASVGFNGFAPLKTYCI